MKEEEFPRKFKQSNPYKVPENYFNEKQQELLEIAGIDEHSKKSNGRSLIWLLSGVAAAIMIGVFFLNPNTGGDENLQLSDFSDEEISQYVIGSYTYDLNEELLILEFPEEEFPEELEPDFTDDELEEFLDINYDQTLHYEYL